MSEEKQGITVSDDVDGRTKYTEIIPTKTPRVKVEKKRQRQREIKIGG